MMVNDLKIHKTTCFISSNFFKPSHRAKVKLGSCIGLMKNFHDSESCVVKFLVQRIFY